MLKAHALQTSYYSSPTRPIALETIRTINKLTTFRGNKGAIRKDKIKHVLGLPPRQGQASKNNTFEVAKEQWAISVLTAHTGLNVIPRIK